MFDRFDFDKSGYLDENDLSRFFIDRQLPRFDLISILLDPDLDGRIYYDMFESFGLNATIQYDFDRSNSLNSSEIALLEADLGVTFHNTSVLARLQWMSASTSLVRDRVQQYAACTLMRELQLFCGYKIDNAIESTRPDRITGPLHVVEQRRAKYLSISRLAPDFLSTETLVVELECDFDGEGSLIVFARFNIPFADLRTECATLTPTNNADCLPCALQSPYMPPLVLQYQSLVPTLDQCRNDKALDAVNYTAVRTLYINSTNVPDQYGNVLGGG
ncbi:hypothetical protein SPRG_08660 [Saprolegnia parasitica CBS 223.65]|uniref:EF-hand domain-containing protein n=1 Tax=Saprolegnia parasitica (strain CBS 223.65) TaxID=695850 RepID=A0A067CGQ5_SAPPC|nr:hypothetical protein SPRG_08660 [Saprolegnia parasitica CBS 223.65]KDO26007.1 hypothetical protein SPRG_08660 [Saprolegnia parasitica CBS 223.65]|eukprot:XP_012203294.1 hypothetical protein SPRG_08660 [Saprolegnia parasitica CBS 223.65]